MPYRSDKMSINNRELDRRIKLSDDDKVDIIQKYQSGMSLRALGREYNVDKATIKSVVNPSWYEDKKEQSKKYSKYYREHVIDNKTRNNYMKNHRKYKNKLLKEGKI